MEIYTSHKLITYEYLNHHGTLFAAKTAELFVEAGFTAAAMAVKDPDKIVLVKVHGMSFTKPIKKGDVIILKSQIVKVGVTSLTAYISITSGKEGYTPVTGFITFVTTDEQGQKIPHGLVLDETKDEAELKLREIAKTLKQKTLNKGSFSYSFIINKSI